MKYKYSLFLKERKKGGKKEGICVYLTERIFELILKHRILTM